MEQKENRIGGIVGAILGGMIGMVPMVIVSFIGFITGWLGIVIAYGAFKGYTHFNGPKNVKFAKTTIISVTIALSFLWTIAVLMLLFMVGEAEYTGVSLPFISIFAGFVGYAFVNKKVMNYIDPNMENRVKFYNTQSEQNNANPNVNATQKRVYIPDVKKLSMTSISLALAIMLPLVVLVAMIFLFENSSDEKYIIAALFGMLFWVIGIVVVSIAKTDRKQRKTAFVTTSDNRIFKVDLLALNSVPNYCFYVMNPFIGFDVSKLSQQENSIMRGTVYRAISDIENGYVSIFDAQMQKAVEEIRNISLIKETDYLYQVSYINTKNLLVKDKILKIYEGFMPFYTPNYSYSKKAFPIDVIPSLCLTAIVLVPLLFAFLIV